MPAVVRRLLGRPRAPADGDDELTAVPDDVPKDGLFTEPLQLSTTTPAPAAAADGRRVARFRVEIRDAEGARCPELAVTAEIEGPERTATGEAHTDLLGRVRFHMEGPPGTYRLRIRHVAGGALAVDETASELLAEQTVGPGAP